MARIRNARGMPMLTRPGDILLVHHKGQPVSYARVEDITADHKAPWWQITLLILAVPAQKVTWILREEYIDGGDFTMGGETMRLERLAPPQATPEPAPDPPAPEPDTPGPAEGGGGGGGEGKVVSLSQRREGRK
jgi:hypothetical protein